MLCLYLSVFLLLFTCVVFSQYSHVILNIALSKGFLFFLSCWVYFKKNEKEKQNIFPKAGLSKLVSGGQWDQDSTLIDQCATNLISLSPLAKLLAFLLKGNINRNCSNVSSSWKLKNKPMLKEELLCTPGAKTPNISFPLFCTKNLKLWPIIILLKLSFFAAAKEDRNNKQLLEQIERFLKLIIFLLLFKKSLLSPPIYWKIEAKIAIYRPHFHRKEKEGWGNYVCNLVVFPQRWLRNR